MTVPRQVYAFGNGVQDTCEVPRGNDKIAREFGRQAARRLHVTQHLKNARLELRRPQWQQRRNNGETPYSAEAGERSKEEGET
jgi:hypothetical protein